MFCPDCHKQFPDASGMCPECFGDLVSAPEQPAAPPPEDSVVASAPSCPARVDLVPASAPSLSSGLSRRAGLLTAALFTLLLLVSALVLAGSAHHPAAPDASSVQVSHRPAPALPPEHRQAVVARPHNPPVAHVSVQVLRRRAGLVSARDELAKAALLARKGALQPAVRLARRALGSLLRYGAPAHELARAYAFVARLYGRLGNVAQARYHRERALTYDPNIFGGRPSPRPAAHRPPVKVASRLPRPSYPVRRSPEPAPAPTPLSDNSQVAGLLQALPAIERSVTASNARLPARRVDLPGNGSVKSIPINLPAITRAALKILQRESTRKREHGQSSLGSDPTVQQLLHKEFLLRQH